MGCRQFVVELFNLQKNSLAGYVFGKYHFLDKSLLTEAFSNHFYSKLPLPDKVDNLILLKSKEDFTGAHVSNLFIYYIKKNAE